MKYVKNNGRYAFAYTYNKGALPMKVEFDRQRIYMDTGNIATTGITAIADDVFEALQENKAFVKTMKERILELVDKPNLSTEDEVARLRAENEKLQKKLNKDTSAKEIEKLEAEKAQLEKDKADMKAQLEALAKSEEKQNEAPILAPAETAKADDSEGF